MVSPGKSIGSKLSNGQHWFAGLATELPANGYSSPVSQNLRYARVDCYGFWELLSVLDAGWINAVASSNEIRAISHAPHESPKSTA